MPDRHMNGTWAMLCAAAFGLAGCAGGNTDSPVTAPGAAKTPTTATLEAGAGLMQDKPPLQALDTYLDGFHFYNGRMSGQMEAHHYCSALNEEVFQCAIFDGNTSSAKLMGVEYIISKHLFEGLPAAEKQLWHSHVHEVKSGQLIAPGIPQAAETRLMKNLVSTYGKTWHTWHTEQGQALPYGVPQLMMGFTADGQIDPQRVRERDSRMGVDSDARKRARAAIETPPIDAGADAWQKGQVWQIKDPTGTHAHP
ncbi:MULTISPECIES: OBAP family protein [Pseudomonas]|uniref:OBAP family protein n=1 Tax=Pseudomonas TaxID=286 RepID=UPI001BEACEFE|nr:MULTISPECIES: OBAP family protein [Pseudomonas]MBT2342384.1 OBAP family protein [Pseudomonas fluorescens]MCD4530105.1 OBAP family protein [Pseudomonas sp. C3-2018]